MYIFIGYAHRTHFMLLLLKVYVYIYRCIYTYVTDLALIVTPHNIKRDSLGKEGLWAAPTGLGFRVSGFWV